MRYPKKIRHVVDTIFIFLIGIVIIACLCAAFLKQLWVYREHIWVTDFRAYYTGSYMLGRGVRASFYTLQTQFFWQHQLFPRLSVYKELLPFLSPPFVALLFTPFLFFPLSWGYMLWGMGNLIILLYFCRVILRTSMKWQEKYILVCLLLTFFPIWNCVILGQTSLILALGLYVSYRSLSNGQDIGAGLWLGLLFIKPQYILLPLTFLLWKKPKAGIACIIAGIIFYMISIGLIGIKGMITYGLFLRHFLNDNGIVFLSIENTWRSFSSSLNFLPILWRDILKVAGNVLFLCGAFWNFGKQISLSLQWVLITLVIILISPHTNYHDLSVLIVPALITVPQGKRYRWYMVIIAGYITCLVDYILTFSGHPFHISVVYMALVFFYLVMTNKSQKH